MATANPVTEEEISCPVCFETFDNKDHEPKRLMCPHSICANCVQRLPEPRQCPLCNKPVTVPVDELAKDLTVLRLQQSHTCAECDKLGELNTCKRCKIRLCELCEKRHKTPEHCKISANIKDVEKKLKTEQIQKIMSTNAESADETENKIEEIFQNIHKEVDVQKFKLCAIARGSCQLNEKTRKVREVPELMTQAALLLVASKPRKQELQTMVDKTSDILRVLNDPPLSFNRSAELVESLKLDVEKLTEEIRKLDRSKQIPSIRDIQNPASVDVSRPNYEAKQQIKRVIDKTSVGGTFRAIRSLAECPQSGRIFVGDIISHQSLGPCESKIHMYEDWKWVKSFPVNHIPHLLLVHEGSLHVAGHRSVSASDYCITAFDPRTGNLLYEQALNTEEHGHKYFASLLGGSIYSFLKKDNSIREWSLKGQVIRSIKLTDCPSEFGWTETIAMNSRNEFSVAMNDSVHIFSNTGQLKDMINLPQKHGIRIITTDYHDNLLLLMSVGADNGSETYVILVYDKDHRHVARIDLSRLGIDFARTMTVTKTGDLVVGGHRSIHDVPNQRSWEINIRSNELYIL